MLTRPRRPDDVARCVGLLRSTYAHNGYPTNWPADPAGWLTGRDMIAAWVAEEADEVIGHVLLRGPDSATVWPAWRDALAGSSGSLAVVSRLIVASPWRRRRVGFTLMEQAEGYATRHGLTLALDVAERNRAAVSFHEHRGWRRVGRARHPPGDEGRPVPLVLFVQPQIVPSVATAGRVDPG